MQNIVSALGSGSGIDIQQLTASLVEAQFANKLARLTSREATLDAQISAAATIKNQFSTLAEALGSRIRAGDLAGKPVSSDPLVVTASVTEGARLTALDYNVEVLRLASAQTLSSPAFASAESAPGPGTLTIELGTFAGTAFTADSSRSAISVSVVAGQSLQSVADAINAAAGGAVRASLIQSSDGVRLTLKGPTGANSGFVVSAQEPLLQSGLGALAYSGGSGGGTAMTLGQAAADAQLKVDGITVERASNRVTDVIAGVTLDLQSVAVGRSVRLSLARPDAALGSALGDLVSALNQVQATLAAATDPQTGELRTDGATRAARRALTQFTSTDLMPNAAAGAPRTLAELGVKTARDGTLTLDQAQFDRAVARDPAAVEALFAPGLYGVGAAVEKMARAVTSSAVPGSLSSSVERYGKLKAALSDERTKLDDASARLRETMTRQFAAMDSRVAAFRSTRSSLENQIRAWNSDRG